MTWLQNLRQEYPNTSRFCSIDYTSQRLVQMDLLLNLKEFDCSASCLLLVHLFRSGFSDSHPAGLVMPFLWARWHHHQFLSPSPLPSLRLILQKVNYLVSTQLHRSCLGKPIRNTQCSHCPHHCHHVMSSSPISSSPLDFCHFLDTTAPKAAEVALDCFLICSLVSYWNQDSEGSDLWHLLHFEMFEKVEYKLHYRVLGAPRISVLLNWYYDFDSAMHLSLLILLMCGWI